MRDHLLNRSLKGGENSVGGGWGCNIPGRGNIKSEITEMTMHMMLRAINT